MTDMQMAFLFFAIAYLIFKGTLFYLFFLASHRVEKSALRKKRKLHSLLNQKRTLDRQRYARVYYLYDLQKKRAL
jgi:hypothetical protein